MLTGLFALAILIARLFPKTPTGRWLRLYLVEVPLQWASRVESKHVLFILVGILAWQAFAIAAPVDLAVIAAWDATIYIDVVAWSWTVAAVARGKAAWSAAKGRAIRAAGHFARLRMRPARNKSPRVRAERSAANDDDDDEALRFVRAA